MVCDKLREIPLTQKHGISLSYLAFILLYGHEIEMYTVEQGEKRDKRQ